MTSGVAGNDVMHNKHIGLLVHFASRCRVLQRLCASLRQL